MTERNAFFSATVVAVFMLLLPNDASGFSPTCSYPVLTPKNTRRTSTTKGETVTCMSSRSIEFRKGDHSSSSNNNNNNNNNNSGGRSEKQNSIAKTQIVLLDEPQILSEQPKGKVFLREKNGHPQMTSMHADAAFFNNGSIVDDIMEGKIMDDRGDVAVVERKKDLVVMGTVVLSMVTVIAARYVHQLNESVHYSLSIVDESVISNVIVDIILLGIAGLVQFIFYEE